MATFKKSEVRAIAARTPAELIGKQISNFVSVNVGYFMKSNANWAYCVHAIVFNGLPVQVVSVFGEIKGAN